MQFAKSLSTSKCLAICSRPRFLIILLILCSSNFFRCKFHLGNLFGNDGESERTGAFNRLDFEVMKAKKLRLETVHAGTNRTHLAIQENNKFGALSAAQNLQALANFWKLPQTCELLIANSNETVQQMRKKNKTAEISPHQYLSATCDDIRIRGYLLDESLLPLEETSFPLAFTILVYNHVWQFERLFRAVYRPQNIYCVHVDLNAKKQVFEAIQHIASCFDNLLVATKRIRVAWGSISIADAELSCMETLRSSRKNWNYLINLTGQEHPLKTMWDVVSIVKSLNGLNSVEGNCPAQEIFNVRVGPLRKLPAYLEVTPCVGSTGFMVTRNFVERLLDDPISHLIHSLLKRSNSPEEAYWATLHFNERLGMPGARDYRKGPPDYNPQLIRLKNWVPAFQCHGKVVRDICIWGVEDLQFLTNRTEIFLNKLHFDFQHYTLDCLELWYWKKVINQLLSHWMQLLKNA